jgi:hypothetical protein
MAKHNMTRVSSDWYSHECMFSIDVLEVFIKNVEEQIKVSIDNYKVKKEALNGKEYDYNEEWGVEIYAQINGLSFEIFDLDETFKEYFPNLQRKSSLITLFSYLEHTLDDLCLLFKASEKYSLDLKDINGKGIERSATYLKKVCGIKNSKGTNEWAIINEIRIIRNLIVHNEGKFTVIEGEPKKSEIDIIKKTEFLDGDIEIKIKEGYLIFVLNTFKAYFKLLDKEIKEFPKL